MPNHRAGDAPSVPSFTAFRNHLGVILICTLLGTALGWGYLQLRPPAYVSETRIFVNPVEGGAYAPSSRNDELTSLETEAQIVRSDAVLASAAAEAPGTPEINELDRRLSVTIPVNTQVLVLSYAGRTPTAAQQTVDAIASAYLETRLQNAESVTAAQLAELEEQTEAVIERLRAATAASQEGTVANRTFQAQLADALNSELVVLRSQRTELETAAPRPGEILSPATLPASGGFARTFAPVAGGAVAGLLLGLAVASLLERRRGLVRSAGDVAALTGQRVVRFPAVGRSTRPRSQRAANEATEEAARRLRTAVLDAVAGGSSVTVSVAGGASDDDPGVAITLAKSVARLGHRVVLVRGDGHAHLETSADSQRPGLANLLAGYRGDARELLQPTQDPRLRILPGSAEPAGSSDLFEENLLRTSLAPVKEMCDFLVLEAPSIVTTRGEALVRVADLTVLVVTLNQSSKADVSAAVNQASELGLPFLAVVLPEKVALQADHAGVAALDDAEGSSAPSVRWSAEYETPTKAS